jgi:phosphatidylglycerol:prolipoprotein diacylglycerol transferase
MHPILLEFGGLTIYAYGVLIAAAFLTALAFTMHEAKRRGLPHKLVPDLGFWIIVGALAGSRQLYVLITPATFLSNPLEIFAIWNGGFVFLGGGLLGGGLGYWFLRRKKQRVLPWLDTAAPGIALGQAVGRIGCLMAGCCYGKPAPELPWAVTFTHAKSIAPLFTPLHPTQIYHSLAGFITFAVLLACRKRFTTPGRLMGLFLVLYAAFRIAIEFFRGDYRGFAGPVSLTQILALAFAGLGVYLLTRQPKAS